jgi:transposase
MGLERYVVDAVLIEKRSPTEIARAHGISRSWLYTLIARVRGGDEALQPHSRRPRSSPREVGEQVVATVLQLRQELVAAGHDRIHKTGTVTLRYRSRLRHIRVGAAHRNKPVHLLAAGAQVRIVTEEGELLRALTIDPTRDYQPLNGRWPVHNVLRQASGIS